MIPRSARSEMFIANPSKIRIKLRRSVMSWMLNMTLLRSLILLIVREL